MDSYGAMLGPGRALLPLFPTFHTVWVLIRRIIILGLLLYYYIIYILYYIGILLYQDFIIEGEKDPKRASLTSHDPGSVARDSDMRI